MDQLELTLEDGSSVWIDRAAVVAFSDEGMGTRITFTIEGGRTEQVLVTDDFAVVSDMMEPAKPTAEPGDFVE